MVPVRRMRQPRLLLFWMVCRPHGAGSWADELDSASWYARIKKNSVRNRLGEKTHAPATRMLGVFAAARIRAGARP